MKKKKTNLEKAAGMFCEIGLIYKNRSPYKISLIKSVRLLNAVIIKNPANSNKIQSAICKVCCHTLRRITAKILTADLIQKAAKFKQPFKC